MVCNMDAGPVIPLGQGKFPGRPEPVILTGANRGPGHAGFVSTAPRRSGTSAPEKGALHVCHDRNHRDRGGHPAVHGPDRQRGRPRRPAGPYFGHPLARARTGHRRLPGRTAGHDAGPGPVLGGGLRLAPVRGPAERPAALHHRDRRARHPFPARPFPARGRAATDCHARVARLDHRAAEDHRAPHQPDGPRRECAGRVPPGDPLAAGSRVLGQADRHRLGPGPDRAGLGRADGAPRVHPVRGPGRRLGRGRHPGHGHPGPGRAGRHPLQHARHRPRRHQHRGSARRPGAVGPVGRGAPRLRAAERFLRPATWPTHRS